MNRSGKAEGFTLIELMIVVSIIAILAAVAIAAYGAYVRRSHNAEAFAMLSDIRLKQESYRATFHRYASPSGTNEWNPSTPSETPNASARVWTVAAGWRQLGVNVGGGKFYFSYTCQGGSSTGTPQSPFAAADGATDDFWYAARASQDLNQDGKCGGFQVTSRETGVSELTTSGGIKEASEFCPQ